MKMTNTLICPECNERFNPVGYFHKYCSKKCRRKDEYKSRKKTKFLLRIRNELVAHKRFIDIYKNSSENALKDVLILLKELDFTIITSDSKMNFKIIKYN